jgi:NADPH:quinone reductase-like Zn-dependent oxidoreductase
MHGAEVTGVDSTGKLDFMRSIGADHVIDYTREDFTKNGKQYDLILDMVAYRSVFAYGRALRHGGSYYVVGGSLITLFQILLLGPLIRRLAGKKIRVLVVQPNLKDLVHIAELCEARKIVPAIDKCFSLNEVPEALRYLGEGHARGKLIIQVERATENNYVTG